MEIDEKKTKYKSEYGDKTYYSAPHVQTKFDRNQRNTRSEAVDLGPEQSMREPSKRANVRRAAEERAS